MENKDKAFLSGLIKEKGSIGLSGEEILRLSDLNIEAAIRLSQELEADGEVKILSFSPLFIVSHSDFGLLCKKVSVWVEKEFQQKPDLTGLSLEDVREKFKIHPKVLEFILKYLGLAGKIKRRGEYIVPPEYKLPVSPEEKKLLAEMEVLLQKGKFRSSSQEELQNLLGVSPDKLKRLMSLLIERKKIVQGKDGFLVDSEWLDAIIARVRNLDKKELRVADFKKMTGLSRKYAIPLLELLDQMKITRRRGSTREIL